MGVQHCHVRDIVREEMEGRGWSIDDVIRESGARTDVYRLALQLFDAMTDDQIAMTHIDETFANLLERAFGVSAQFWLNFDASYHAARKESE